jgi:uncharacterized protein YutE (UPF0331/DUF86 family)
MVDRDVVAAKLAVIDRSLARIAEVRARRDELQPFDLDDITALNLQRAIQAAIGLASHVAATERLGLPDSAGAVFPLLAERGILDRDLAERLRRMVGFRNLAVHDYQEIDPKILEAIVEGRLGDLRELGARVVAAFGLA